MTQHLIDIDAGCLRPSWTNNEAVGFLVTYMSIDDERSAEEQMSEGYERTAGTRPYLMDHDDFTLGFAVDNGGVERSILFSDEHGEEYEEVSRTTAPDGATVIMFKYAFTAIVRDGQLQWLARLD